MRNFHGPAVAAFFLAISPAAADPAQIVLSFTDSLIVPRFRTVAETAKAQDDAWTSYCADRVHTDPQVLRSAFNKVGDAWANVEFFRIGPAAIELRADRFNYWLDKRDATGSALSALLASTDPNSLAPTQLAAANPAGQGMPILERLLFGDDALAQLSADGSDGARRCEIGKAVADNLSTIADAIVADWTSPDGARAAIAANKGWKTSFADTTQAANVMLTEIVGGLDALKDKKAAYLFHDAANEHAPRLAEASRSGRSLRDIEINLASLREASDVFAAQSSTKQREDLDEAFADASAKLTALEALKSSAPKQQRLEAIRATLNELDELSEAAEDILPAATGLSLGFNNLDGD